MFFFVFLGKLKMFSKVTRLTTEHIYLPSQNASKGSFFAGRAKKALGQRPKPSAGAGSFTKPWPYLPGEGQGKTTTECQLPKCIILCNCIT